MNNIIMIALTGGPCSGKSSAIAYVKEQLEPMGFAVVTVPEAATELINKGIAPGVFTDDGLEFQRMVLERVLLSQKEARFAAEFRQKHEGFRPVVLCDRGVPDILAYTTKLVYGVLLEEYSLGTADAVKERMYDAVIHMTTAADGAERYYTLENNQARSESPAEARLRDRGVRNAWIGHPHFHVVDNSTNFKKKLDRVLAHVCNTLGTPEPMEFERKYLVQKIHRTLDWLSEQDGVVVQEIRQAYLPAAPGDEERIRSRTICRSGFTSYFHTMKHTVSPGKRVERERLISVEEFSRLALSHGLHGRFLEKTRLSFVENGRHFELDYINSKEPSLTTVLECEVPTLSENPVIPTWIEIKGEVTGRSEFSNHELWKRKFA